MAFKKPLLSSLRGQITFYEPESHFAFGPLGHLFCKCVWECPENIKFSGIPMPTATFLEIFNGLFFWQMLWICVQNLKFVGLPVPVITGGTPQNLDSPWIRPRSLFSEMFSGLSDGPSELIQTKFEVRSSIGHRNFAFASILIYAFQRYCRFCAPARHFFPTPPLVSPKFSHVPWA